MGELVGRDLSSVEYVRDYVQLHFDGGDLTAYTLPVLSWGAECVRSGEAGYRDALCELIGVKVAHVEADDERMSVAFENGAAVSISFLNSDYRGPEALQFRLDGDERIWVA